MTPKYRGFFPVGGMIVPSKEKRHRSEETGGRASLWGRKMNQMQYGALEISARSASYNRRYRSRSHQTEVAIKLRRMNGMIPGEWNESSGCSGLQYDSSHGFLFQLMKFSLQQLGQTPGHALAYWSSLCPSLWVFLVSRLGSISPGRFSYIGLLW